MASSLKQMLWFGSKAAILLMMVISVAQLGQAQDCSVQMNSLNSCVPFVMPGATVTTPSPDCCNALRSVNQDCLCNTMAIASRLPSTCNVPPLTCPN